MHQSGRTSLPSPVFRGPHCSRFGRTSSRRPEGIRHELVERVRREIAEGTYDTPEKWAAALDRLLDQLEE